MLIPNKFNGYSKDGIRLYHFGGGGGGPTQTTSTVQNTNVPEYARPYVETMLGATQEQLFQGNRTPVTTDPNTGQTTGGDFNITGFKPYQAYGGTYDAQGNQTSYDPSKAVAGFQPMQETAQRGIAGLQMPGEFGQASGITQAAAQNAMNMRYRGDYARNQFRSPGQYQNAQFNMQQVQNPDLQNYQMGPAERVRTQSFAQPGSAEAYMSPYMQNVVGIQQREATRASEMQRNQNQAQAVGQGAFGGSRQAIIEAERQRNLGTQLGDIQATGSQAAYQQAQQQFNAEQAARLQAQQANQQAGLTVGQQNLGANLGVQQLGAGQNLQAQLANQQMYQAAQQAAEQSRQFGYGQNMNAAQQRAQYGLAANQLNAQQQQFGATYGQNANAQALAAANQLAGIGQQGLTAQQGIYGLQNQVGAQQQALEQQKINQAMQDYANAQQYPLMQLGTMSNMLRGLPMQASSTQQYQAAPNQLSQAIGTIGAGASIYNAFNPAPGRAAGGEIKGYAKGGIMSYDMGGEVEEQLESMDEKGLATQARESSSPSIRKMAQRLLRERQMSKQPQGTGPMGVQYQAAQAPMPAMRAGGIIAFQQGAGGNGSKSAIEEGGEKEAKVGMAERLAMPPTTGGIMSAAPIVSPAPAPAEPSPDILQGAMKQRDIFAAQANRTTADILKEIEAEREASGIGDNKAREEYRAQQMAERANMKDEQARQRNMRLAEFFAAWGSTPGPVLVAGMNALKQSIPGIISDEKEAKKARKEADKIIYDIDEATRLDKLGMHDKAVARREQAAKHAEEYNKYLLTFQSQRESDKSALERTRESDKSALERTNIQTEGNLEQARIQARAQSTSTAQRGRELEMANIERSLEISRRRLADVEKDIEATRTKPPKGTPLAKAMESVNRYKSALAAKKGDASKVDAYITEEARQAAETIDKFETNATRRLNEARSQVRTYEDIFVTQGRGAKSGTKTAPAMDDNPLGLDLGGPAPTSPAAPAAAPAPAPAKPSTSRTGDASSANPYVDSKGRPIANAPKGGASLASQAIDAAPGVAKDVANKVNETLNSAELRYLKDKIARKENLSVTDRIRAERAGLL